MLSNHLTIKSNIIGRLLAISFSLLALAACQSAYYSTLEKVGIHKRDILIDRIEETQEAQEDAQEEFKDALTQFKALVGYDGGNLEKLYSKLDGEYQDSADAAETINKRIESVETVANDLFEEWQKELELYKSNNLRQESSRKLRQTKRQYHTLLRTMKATQSSIKPVLSSLHDRVLFLKHNLNARAVSSLKGELNQIELDVDSLISKMQRSIKASEKFIKDMRQ